MRKSAALLGALLIPGSARAHDAFGDLGAFYQSLLHPLADPAQGLLLAGLAIVLACQPRENVQWAYLALIIATLAASWLSMTIAFPELKLRWVGLGVAALGVLALSSGRVWLPVLLCVTVAIAVIASFAPGFASDPRTTVRAIWGSILGILLVVLLVWGLLDSLQARLGRPPGLVAASWIVAIGIMAAALPEGVA
ncbi:hypothetical protein [Paracoccus ravus]|uniref:hypothetical protein n=1 Tax=Paracoccus ravus TaxID=2447760 RepID=UPI00106EB1C1|nr:hypothetical protein [Paracoccus ravus]